MGASLLISSRSLEKVLADFVAPPRSSPTATPSSSRLASRTFFKGLDRFAIFALVSVVLHVAVAGVTSLLGGPGVSLSETFQVNLVTSTSVSGSRTAPARRQAVAFQHEKAPVKTKQPELESTTSNGVEGRGVADEAEAPHFEVSGSQAQHPYFQSVWSKVNRASQNLSLSLRDDEVILKILLIVEKRGLISDTRIQVVKGRLSPEQLQSLRERLYKISRLDPVPSEIADSRIGISYPLRIKAM